HLEVAQRLELARLRMIESRARSDGLMLEVIGLATRRGVLSLGNVTIGDQPRQLGGGQTPGLIGPPPPRGDRAGAPGRVPRLPCRVADGGAFLGTGPLEQRDMRLESGLASKQDGRFVKA